MSYPTVRPLMDEYFSTSIPAGVASGGVATIRVPLLGIIYQVGAMVGSAITTADATVTTSILNPGTTNTTPATFVLTQAASVEGTQNAIQISDNNFVQDGDCIRFVLSGSGTGGGPLTCFAFVRRGSEKGPSI